MNNTSLDRVRCFLLDMDGTFYLGNQIIPGSLDFIEKVRATGRDFMFLTNNSSHNAAFYVQRLARMGLHIDRTRVMTSGEATCEKLLERYPGQRVFVLGNEFLLEEFREYGIEVDPEHPDIVVIGFDTTLDYHKMQVVCDYVRAGLRTSPRIRISTVPPKRGSCPTSGRSWLLSKPPPGADPI